MKKTKFRIYSLPLTQFLLRSPLKNAERCSQTCDSNNGDVLSKLVSDTAWSLDVIYAGNDEKKRCYSFSSWRNEEVFQNLSQKSGNIN